MDIETIKYESLFDFVIQCNKLLIIDNPIEFRFPDKYFIKTDEKKIKNIKQLNSNLLKNLRHKANLYAIYKKPYRNRKWKLVYIGERKSKKMRERITQHLIKKSPETGSKIDKIKSIIENQGKIGVSFLKIEPETLRCFVEEELIKKHSDLWNNHGSE